MDTNQGDAYQEVKRSWPAETQRVRQTLNPARYHSSILGRNEQRRQSLCKRSFSKPMSKPVALGLLACNPKWPLWSELATKLTATRGPGSPRSLHEMRIAADANDCGGRTTRVQGLPTDYAKNHQVVDKWMAIWKHVKAINARPLSFDKYLTSKWERVHGTGTR